MNGQRTAARTRKMVSRKSSTTSLKTHISDYVAQRKRVTLDKLAATLSQENLEELSETAFDRLYKTNTRSMTFHQFYYRTLRKRKLFLSTNDFFRRFKQQYSLQGIDTGFLDELERNKEWMLRAISGGRLADLYFQSFNAVEIKWGESTRVKSLGSFFAKLVHTFAPNRYCALDNPIKKYLKLSHEAFFMAFLIVSESYRDWISRNPEAVATMRDVFRRDQERLRFEKRTTDLKLLDLVLWHVANPPKKRKAKRRKRVR